MSSRKEEERNEKIIRGLMKLPPNRKCINCNSLGPQYVCTNFWTFVCIACSGIHREFTHRVKSVSMSKFTSQEVEALQKGGNQRAREIYLKEWDLQRQRLPDSSKVDRVREFIKHVYVDKKYAGGKTSDKPPRDLQNLRNLEDETRRASSYHSYSQSPPYDHQYEDRRYGKQGAVLTRKPGSDRGHEGKISSFVYSPGRLSEQMYEDRFANEGSGSGSRVSDYSVSSGGDPFRSDTQSPKFQTKDTLSGDARNQTINTSSVTNVKIDEDGIRRPQRTASLGSYGSFDSSSMSLKSVDSSSLMDVVPKPEQSWAFQEEKPFTFPSIAQSSHPGNSGSFNLSEAPIVPQPATSPASTLDLFQLPASLSAPPVDLFQPSSISSASSMNLSKPPQTPSTPSLDSFFVNSQQQPHATLDKKLSQNSIPKNEGWATFDIPQPATSNLDKYYPTPTEVSSSDGDTVGKSYSVSSDTSMQWPSFEDSNVYNTSSSVSAPWHEGLIKNEAVPNVTTPQSWNAFEDSIGTSPLDNTDQSSKPQVSALAPASYANQYFDFGVSEDLNREGTQRAGSDGRSYVSTAPPHGVTGPSNTPPPVPVMGTLSHATDLKSSNPFDFPFDSELGPSNMFLDMSSLQAALPNSPLPSSFLGGVSEPWFPANPATPYIPDTPQGGLAYIAGQASSPQLPNVPTQGSVASIGGNPFA